MIPTSTKNSRVLSLNNQAVRCLQQQDYRKSIETFLLALGKQKEAIKATTSSSSSRQQEAAHALQKLPSEEEDRAQQVINEKSYFISQSLECTSTREEEDAPFQLFDRVFLLSRHDPTSASHRDGTSAVILFNMAMAHHHRGIRFNQRLQLAKAVRMYQWALSAVQHWEKTTSCPNNSSGCHVLRLAILNNMAHANYCGRRNQDAVHSLKCLRDILVYAKGCVPPKDFAFFTGNIVALCHKSGGIVQAPAAAA